MGSSRPITSRGALVWIVCLACLSVGARNFEDGLSIDGPLYASIARHIVQRHEWFRLYGGVPDFTPYVEHPHLGFWAVALVFKLLPIADWSARIVGHLFYVAFLFLFFCYVRRVCDEKTAVWGVLLLWVWYRFSNFFSNVYLDPGALFFGSASLFAWQIARREGRPRLASLSGALLGACALYKGLTVLGFLPAWAAITLSEWPRRTVSRAELRLAWRETLICLGTALAICAAYAIALRYSSVPNFLSLYWSRQMNQRFEKSWHWSGLLSPAFWGPFVRDSFYLAPFALFAARPGRSRRHLLLPFILLVTFVLMYAPADRNGNQYTLMWLPWLAWLIADGALALVPIPAGELVRWSTILALTGVCLIQYLPIRTHRAQRPSETDAIREVAGERGLRELVLDEGARRIDFITSAPLAWYTGLDVLYSDAMQAPVAAERLRLYLLVKPSELRERQLKEAGWCFYRLVSTSSLWLACKSQAFQGGTPRR